MIQGPQAGTSRQGNRVGKRRTWYESQSVQSVAGKLLLLLLLFYYYYYLLPSVLFLPLLLFFSAHQHSLWA